MVLKVAAVALSVGLAAGWWLTSNHHEVKHVRYVAGIERAEKLRIDKSKVVTDELYAKWKDAANADPVIVERIVRVRAAGPVQACEDGTLDNGNDATRVKLDGRIVRDIESLTKKHEKRYEKCAIQLRAAQVKSGTM